MNPAINGDGFGVGWYSPPPQNCFSWLWALFPFNLTELLFVYFSLLASCCFRYSKLLPDPCVFRSVLPSWNCANLRHIAQHTKWGHSPFFLNPSLHPPKKKKKQLHSTGLCVWFRLLWPLSSLYYYNHRSRCLFAHVRAGITNPHTFTFFNSLSYQNTIFFFQPTDSSLTSNSFNGLYIRGELPSLPIWQVCVTHIRLASFSSLIEEPLHLLLAFKCNWRFNGFHWWGVRYLFMQNGTIAHFKQIKLPLLEEIKDTTADMLQVYTLILNNLDWRMEKGIMRCLPWEHKFD